MKSCAQPLTFDVALGLGIGLEARACAAVCEVARDVRRPYTLVEEQTELIKADVCRNSLLVQTQKNIPCETLWA